MTDNTGFSLKKEIPLTLLAPIIGCICSLAILFYRVDMLEKNGLNTQAVLERLVKVEVKQEIIITLLKNQNNN